MPEAQVGFSQRVRIEWLEATAFLYRDGKGVVEIEAALMEILGDHVSVGTTAVRGNIHKAITILLKVWVTVPEELRPFRDQALQLLDTTRPSDRLVLHWGLSMAAYPFFAAVATHVGRLLRLQGSVAYPQILRRVCEQYGERDTVTRAGRRVVRCFVDWGVLTDSAEAGVYVAGPCHKIEDTTLASWLMEAMLRASGSRPAAFAALHGNPALFPFSFNGLSAAALAKAPRLEVFRQGLDDNVITLR